MKAGLLILEGNICAGKTSLARDLGKLLNYHVFLEPMVTNPYLERYYKEPQKFALTMQLWLLRQRFKTYISATKFVLEHGKGVILDRSVFSDWVFAEKNRKDGNISEDGYREYLKMRQNLLAHLPIPQITLYLDVSPEECHKRIHTLRKRDFEAGIPLDYLAGLDTCYNSFLTMMESSGSKVIRVPWNTFGESRQVADSIKQYSTSLPELSELVDVPKLSDYVYNNHYVRSIVEDTYNEEKELSCAERETQDSQERSQNTTNTLSSPNKILVNCS